MEEKRDVAYRRGARGGRDSGGRGRRCRSGGAPPAHRARGGAEEDLQRWRPDGLSRSITGLVLQPLYQRAAGRLNRIRNRVRPAAVSSDWSAVGVATPAVGGARHVVVWAVASGSRNRNSARARQDQDVKWALACRLLIDNPQWCGI
jgi:hypothetical protein